MTLVGFLLAANAAGLRLAAVDGRLELRGPPEAACPRLRQAAAEHKGALLRLLRDPGWEPPPQRQGFRHDHDWRDWRLEWLLTVGQLCLRLRGCRDPEAAARLQPLLEATPGSPSEWLDLGRRIADAEHELRRQGRLPDYPWPPRGGGGVPGRGP